jgi:hypothetical protein
MNKTFTGKAPSTNFLCCNGIKCCIRALCARYNLEPNEHQKFISPIHKGEGCKYFLKMEENNV